MLPTWEFDPDTYQWEFPFDIDFLRKDRKSRSQGDTKGPAPQVFVNSNMWKTGSEKIRVFWQVLNQADKIGLESVDQGGNFESIRVTETSVKG
jgi:hypothetical protein